MTGSAVVAVTGASGYVGGRLVEHLGGAGSPVRAIVRERRPWLGGDQREVDLTSATPDQLRAALEAVDTVVHLAGASEAAQDQAAAKAATIAGTERLADAVAAAGVRRLVHLSTVHVYGSHMATGGTLTEDLAPQPVHPYAEARLACEEVLAEVFGGAAELVVLRLSNAVGAPLHPLVDRWTLVANDLCRQAVVDGALGLRSSGLQWRDFVALSDACHAISAASSPGFQPGTYNLGSGRSTTVLALAHLVADVAETLLGARPPVHAPPHEGGRPAEYAVSIDRLVAAGWRPAATTTDALVETMEFCLRHRDQLPR